MQNGKEAQKKASAKLGSHASQKFIYFAYVYDSLLKHDLHTQRLLKSHVNLISNGSLDLFSNSSKQASSQSNIEFLKKTYSNGDLMK